MSRRWFWMIPGKGIIDDVKARAPFYISDWTDAWNYRVIPATVFTFFANVLPGIAFSLDLIETTNKYGVEEVLLSSFMAAFIFSVFGAQPLVIAGVTGPITVLNKTIFDILNARSDAPDYLQFIGWVYFWGAILHFMAAILNWCNLLRFVTRFSCDTFGFFVSWVYLQYGIQVLTRQLSTEQTATAYLSILLAVLMTISSFLFQLLSSTSFFNPTFRRFLSDYGMPISIVASTGLAYWGRFNDSNPPTLPIQGAFTAAGGRNWLVRFWELDAKWVGAAFPFGVVLFILFFFDHNVSSLIAQGSEFPLRKPPGFHYDFFLLGITTFLAGLLGLPAPNGLIPQAPIHTRSLLILGEVHDTDEAGSRKMSIINEKQEQDAELESEVERGRLGENARERGIDNEKKDGSETAPEPERSPSRGAARIDDQRMNRLDTESRDPRNQTRNRGSSLIRKRRPSHSHSDYRTRPSTQSRSHSRPADRGRVRSLHRTTSEEPPEERGNGHLMLEGHPRSRTLKPIGVVEQRVSNLAQGGLCLVLCSGPFLHLLNLIPRGVLAGLFWYMGLDALLTSGVTLKLLHLIRDKELTPPSIPFLSVRPTRLILFLLIELVGFGVTFAIVQTKAAIGFPVVIALLVPIAWWLPKSGIFGEEEIRILDGPTASPFTMESVGGAKQLK